MPLLLAFIGRFLFALAPTALLIVALSPRESKGFLDPIPLLDFSLILILLVSVPIATSFIWGQLTPKRKASERILLTTASILGTFAGVILGATLK
jgi:hypothetical protein